MTRHYILAASARADIVSILIVSYDRFGSRVRDGYEQLIAAAIDSLVSDPAQVGVRERSDLGTGIRAWHLRSSRDEVPVEVRRIITPRHIVFFREVEDEVHILRILHEAMDLPGQSYS